MFALWDFLLWRASSSLYFFPSAELHFNQSISAFSHPHQWFRRLYPCLPRWAFAPICDVHVLRLSSHHQASQAIRVCWHGMTGTLSSVLLPDLWKWHNFPILNSFVCHGVYSLSKVTENINFGISIFCFQSVTQHRLTWPSY